ncbi:MAG TPA: TetR/AcrR family transcriptional regulator [Bacilli bacterium]|nr:TetR/AcrR family transcriptional regulator [Bacilli bacterium]
MGSTKNRIVKAAVKLFKERGFHQVTVRNIAEEAQVSNGGFYHHFKTKDELLFYINEFIMDYVIKCAEKVIRKPQTPVEKMYGIVSSFVRAFYVYNLEVVVMYQESHYLAPEYYEKMRVKRDQYSQIVMEVIEEGVRTKEFRNVEPIKMIGFMIFGMVNWTYTWYEPTGELSIEEISERYVDFIFNALLTEEAKKNTNYKKYFIPCLDLE